MRCFLSLALFLVGSAGLHLDAQVSVDEHATRAILEHDHTSISLAIQNRLSEPAEATVRLEWLDPSNVVVGSAQQVVSMTPENAGLSISAEKPSSRIRMTLPLPERVEDQRLLRLHYTVVPKASHYGAFAQVSGIVSLVHIAPYAFSLQVVGVPIGHPGAPFDLRVLASHPVTHEPVANVHLEVSGFTATTGKDGWAALKPELSEGFDGYELSVSGRLGDFRQQADIPYLVVARGEIRIQTDKPLYQPGQTLHVRTLARNSDGRAYGGEQQAIRVLDERGDAVHVASVNSSKYGIAWTDWVIPTNATPGKYTIEVSAQGLGDPFEREVEIRKYELPSFRVNARSMRPYYLGGQEAKAEVKAEYLFGKPVERASARIEDQDGKKTVWRGQLDVSGAAQALLPLNMSRISEGENFVDQQYTAFVTDPSTNRTEQREFAVRLSRSGLHLYVVQQEARLGSTRLYVSAYLPDGLPAKGVAVHASTGVECSTNRFGLCALNVQSGADPIKLYAVSTAGERSETIEEQAGPGANLALETDRALYRKGSAIQCHLSADEKDAAVLLMAWNERGQVVFSRKIQVGSGGTTVAIPYSEQFGERLSLAATDLSRNRFSSTEVLFPSAGRFAARVTPAKQTYRPGEMARIEFHTSSPAALGIAIVDQSVIDRAQTDAVRRRPGWQTSAGTVGGISQADLLHLEPAKIDGDYELVARALASRPPPLIESTDWLNVTEAAFLAQDGTGLGSVKRSLDELYLQNLTYPRDEHELYAEGVRVSGLRDPWNGAYYPMFRTEGSEDVLCLESSGPDKQKGTEDDYCALRVTRRWFGLYEALIRKALAGRPDYPASEQGFYRELEASGISFPGLRDRWGNPLHVGMSYAGAQREIQISSAGPDGKWGTTDDVAVAGFSGTYFSESSEAIRRVLATVSPFPLNSGEAVRALNAGGVRFDDLRDPWGHRFSLTVRIEERFQDRISFYTFAEYGRPAEQRQKITPIKLRFGILEVRSDGPDEVSGTGDDVTVGTFANLLNDESAPRGTRTGTRTGTGLLVAGKAAITGIVRDPSGAAVPGASVSLNGLQQAATDSNGTFMLAGVPAGIYEMSVESPGFQRYTLADVPALAGQVTQADVELRLGSVSQTVQVQASALNISTFVASSVRSSGTAATPRLREYFPETLYWRPELVTDGKGNASIDVKLADSVTMWRVALTASTLDGEVSEEEAEMRAFQPLVVDLDVPAVLTQGDRISLPVPIRNYRERAQHVHVSAAATAGLTSDGKIAQPSAIAAGTSADVVLNLHASGSSPAAKVRVTAMGDGASDAIEKTLAIHPDGQLRERSTSDVINSSGNLALTIPPEAIADSLHAEVRIYPGMVSRIVEAMKVLLKQPSGCGEQTVSLAYPNLLFLRAVKQAGIVTPALEARALRNLQLGYVRLLRYQEDSGVDSGAFTYWGRNDTDVALTAYVLRFLRDARGFIAVDEARIRRAQTWLAAQKPADDRVKALQMEALLGAQGGSAFDVDKRLAELARKASQFNDPYAVAQFALGAMEAGKGELARDSISTLITTAQPDRGAVFWSLVANTPFHGWGHAGQLETTALAVRALAVWRNRQPGDAASGEALRKGVLYLLRNTAGGGGWSTGQSTVQALLALLETWHQNGMADAAHFLVQVDGVRAGEVDTNRNNMLNPLTMDVSRFVHSGHENRVTVSNSRPGQAVEAQFDANWYQPWQGDQPSGDLTLETRYDGLNAEIDRAITCHVKVSRPNFRGYGMLIARIGLPPGSEVDRGTLAAVTADPRGSVDSYEVAPDSVTFYVWPRAADNEFSFVFRPRFAAEAKSAESVLYDYYNPDDRATEAPQTFQVH